MSLLPKSHSFFSELKILGEIALGCVVLMTAPDLLPQMSQDQKKLLHKPL